MNQAQSNTLLIGIQYVYWWAKLSITQPIKYIDIHQNNRDTSGRWHVYAKITARVAKKQISHLRLDQYNIIWCTFSYVIYCILNTYCSSMVVLMCMAYDNATCQWILNTRRKTFFSNKSEPLFHQLHLWLRL
jgi:hypothetical protein